MSGGVGVGARSRIFPFLFLCIFCSFLLALKGVLGVSYRATSCWILYERALGFVLFWSESCLEEGINKFGILCKSKVGTVVETC